MEKSIQKVKKGDRIAVHYEGRFETGEVFDSSKHDSHEHPLEFVAGEGHVVPGFDNAVLGMVKGEEKEVTIKPQDGYGPYNADLTQQIPRNLLPKDQEPQVGMMLVVGSPDGQQMPVKITAVDKETITIDINHPLAGKTLVFKLSILDINYEEGKYAHKH